MTDRLDEDFVEILKETRQGIKAKIAMLEGDLADVNRQLLNEMAKVGVNDHLSGKHVIQVVQNTTTNYDWNAIKSKVGLLRWKTLVREVPDAELLDKAIAAGKIKVTDVAQYITKQDKGSPYVKVTTRKQNTQEGNTNAN